MLNTHAVLLLGEDANLLGAAESPTQFSGGFGQG
jgi:hypothetical protein